MIREANHAQPMATSARLTQIAMAIRPSGMIATMVLPEVMVPAMKFEYSKFEIAEAFTIPDTLIGRSAQANRVEFGSTLKAESTETHGLEDAIPIQDISDALAAGAPDPQDHGTETTSLLVSLAREKRVADLIGAVATYDADKRKILAGNSQWSDYENSNPLTDILEAMDATLMKPNTMVLGNKVWTKLRGHPKIVEAVRGTGAGAEASGIVMRQAVADLFEVDQLLVGEPWFNSAKEGQDAAYSRLWGNHCSLLHLNAAVSQANGKMPTFGFTATWKTRRTGTYDEPGRGAEGSVVVKTVEDVKELVVCKELGYHFHDAVA